jgi:hypothetical protein
MSRAQRIILLVYCLLVVYCGVWVPWHYDIGAHKGIKEGYALVWNGPPEGQGVPDLAAVALRVVAATGLCAAAFLLAGRWKALLSVAILAAAGIALYGYWTGRVTERRARKIHDCAIAKVATGVWGCEPSEGQFQVCDSLPKSPTARQEDEAIAAAEKQCASEIGTKQKSAHEQIEEYKRQHGIKE